MFFLLLSLFSKADEPSATITVTDTRYEEIYFEDPRVICDTPCTFDQDTSVIFIEANRKHTTWFKQGKVAAVYNQETIELSYEDCDFKKDTFKCANENGLWVLRTTVMQDEERASINLMLFDENAVMIGQSTFTRFKKTKVIQRKKVTKQQNPSRPLAVNNCNQQTGTCSTLPVQIDGQTTSQVEDLEPVVIDIPPTITSKDVGQAMIMLYDSVR
jgi:hypothetical protein